MTYQELVDAIKKLSCQQRQSLLVELEQSLRADDPAGEVPAGETRPSSLARVRGMLQVDGPLSSDEELMSPCK